MLEERTIGSERVLLADGGVRPATITVREGRIVDVREGVDGRLDHSHGSRLLAPGIVDLHGDAFERVLTPRPNVRFPPEIGLPEADRQLVANGVTTAYYALTVSWEPGLRSVDAARSFLQGLDAVRPSLACDPKLHLRFETHAFEAEPTIAEWLTAGRVDLLAFNDHIEFIAEKVAQPDGVLSYVRRTGLGANEFRQLLEATRERRPAAPAVVESVAAKARAANVPMASHDDEAPEVRRQYDQLGCAISEFPVNERTATAARDLGNPVVLGAPNVVRGRSHDARLCATEAIRANLCSALASDYYYPAPLRAALKLVDQGIVDFGRAWALVSSGPAEAAGLSDRGTIATGKRADVVALDESASAVCAVYVGGRLVYSASELISQPEFGKIAAR